MPVWVKSSGAALARKERHTAQVLPYLALLVSRSLSHAPSPLSLLEQTAFFHLDQLLHTNAVVPTVGRVLTQDDFMRTV